MDSQPMLVLKKEGPYRFLQAPVLLSLLQVLDVLVNQLGGGSNLYILGLECESLHHTGQRDL